MRQGRLVRLQALELVAYHAFGGRNEADRPNPGPGALALRLVQAMKEFHGCVPGVRTGQQPVIVAHEGEQLGHAVGAVLLEEEVGELLSRDLPQVVDEQELLVVVEGQLVIPDVAKFGTRVDPVVCVVRLV